MFLVIYTLVFLYMFHIPFKNFIDSVFLNEWARNIANNGTNGITGVADFENSDIYVRLQSLETSVGNLEGAIVEISEKFTSIEETSKKQYELLSELKNSVDKKEKNHSGFV